MKEQQLCFWLWRNLPAATASSAALVGDCVTPILHLCGEQRGPRGPLLSTAPRDFEHINSSCNVLSELCLVCFSLSVCLSIRSDDLGPIVKLAIRYRATAAGGVRGVGVGCSMSVVMLTALSSPRHIGSHTCPRHYTVLFFPTPSALRHRPIDPPMVLLAMSLAGWYELFGVSGGGDESKSRWQPPARACTPYACVFFKTPTLCSTCHVHAA